MADNEMDLMEVQVGKESTWGTSVAATAKLMEISDCELNPMVESELIDEDRGSLQPGYESQVDGIEGTGSIDGVATYEDLPYLLDSLMAEATPSGIGPYTYAYSAPIGSKPASRILTLIKGSALDVRELAGGLINELEISIVDGSPVEFSAGLIGKEVAASALAALSDRSVNIAHANHGAIYIDDFGGTIGTTLISTVAYEITLGLNANRAVQHGIGNLKPGDHKMHKWEGGSQTLEMSLELDATTAGYLTALTGVTDTPWQKLVRIELTKGTNIIQLDFAGFAPSAPDLWTDQDGVSTLEFTLQGQYESGLANFFAASVTNDVSALA